MSTVTLATISAQISKLDDKIESVEVRLEAEIGRLDKKVHTLIDTVRKDLDRSIHDLAVNVESYRKATVARFDSIDQRFDVIEGYLELHKSPFSDLMDGED